MLSHVLQANDHGPCGCFDSNTVFTYDDAGMLTSAEDTATGGCPRTTEHLLSSFVHPSPGVQIEQLPGPDGGTRQLKRTVFDERGNPTAVDVADLPDSTWHPQLRRSYDCFRR